MSTAERCVPDVTISIVSFNCRDYLAGCLDSIPGARGELDVEVIVVDNDSTDRGADLVREEYSAVMLIPNETNVGFAAAHNQAIRESSGRYFLLLNPDTFLLPGSIERLVSFMENHLEAGAVGASTWLEETRSLRGGTHKVFNMPFILLAHTGLGEVFPNNKVFRDGWEVDRRVWGCGNHCEVERLTGESLMVRREAIEEVGALDEGFFMYLEDTDWCLRMRRKGWKLYWCTDAEVIHYIGGSSGEGSVTSRYFANSLRYYILKYYGRAGYLFFLLVRVFGLGAAKLLRAWRRLAHRRSRESEEETLITPASNELVWGPLVGVDSYYVELSDGPTFIRQCCAPAKGARVEIPEEVWRHWPEGVYYWRVIPAAANVRSGVFRRRRFVRRSS
jgi:N-acetylglucosaminyl-diphospho-decaprenol L-rhamnosyltransferase